MGLLEQNLEHRGATPPGTVTDSVSRLSQDGYFVASLDDLGLSATRLIQEVAPLFALADWDPYDVRRRQIEAIERRIPAGQLSTEAFWQLEIARGLYACPLKDQIGEARLLQRFNLTFGIDTNTIPKIAPFRKKCVTGLELARASGAWKLRSFRQGNVVQYLGDIRAIPRTHPAIPEQAFDRGTHLLQTVERLVSIAAALHLDAETATARVWLVDTRCQTSEQVSVVPEGDHRDGAHVVVPAVVIANEAVIGAKSRILRPQEGGAVLLDERQLQPGELSMLNDEVLLHGVSPLEAGSRKILGLDIVFGAGNPDALLTS